MTHNLELEEAPVDVRRQTQGIDRPRRHRFEPDGLPNSARCSVESALGLQALLTMRIGTLVRGIPDLHQQPVFPALYCMCDIERKALITPGVPPDLLAVHEYDSIEIDGAEMQQQSLVRSEPM